MLYQLCYLLHCISKRQKRAAIGALMQIMLSAALLIVLL